MSDHQLALLAWWRPADDGAPWSEVDAAWLVLLFVLEAAESSGS